MAMLKGFREFLCKTGVFLGLFVLVQMALLVVSKNIAFAKEYYFILDVDIGKALLFTAIIFFFLSQDTLKCLKEHRFEIGTMSLFGTFSVLTFVGYYFLKKFLVANPEFAVKYIFLFFPLKELALIFGTIFLATAVYGLKFSISFVKDFKKELTTSFWVFISSLFLIIQFQKLWVYLSYIVAKVAYFFLNLTFNASLNFSGSSPILGITNFVVSVGKPCSGIDSMLMFIFLYVFIAGVDWEKLNKTKLALMFILGVVSVFFLNIIRIYLLVTIGAFFSKEFAIGLFHTNASMIIFLIYFGIFWGLFYNWMKKPEFRKKKKRGFIGRRVDKVMGDSLYRNSIYLMMNTLIMCGFGFIFWMVASRLYLASDIGLATAIISVMGLIVGLSVLGLNVGLIRYLPGSKNKNKKINTSFTLVALSTIVVTCIFIMFSRFIVSKLMFIHDNIFMAFIFMAFMIVASLNILMESIFIALRNTKYVLIKNSLFSILKIFGLFFVVWLWAFGIFSSWMVSLLVGFLITLFVLIRKYGYRPKFAFYDSILKQIGKYSFGNYVAGFIGGLPLLILPILVLNKLGSEFTAYYYMSMMIASLLFIVPQATAQSLFAEGSYSEKKLKEQVKKAVKIISLILIPGILIVVFFGQYVLILFGAEYAREGVGFLRIIAVSGVFVGVNGIFRSLLKVRKRVKTLIYTGILTTLIIIGLSYIFIGSGLIGIALAWIIGQISMGVVYLLFYRVSD